MALILTEIFMGAMGTCYLIESMTTGEVLYMALEDIHLIWINTRLDTTTSATETFLDIIDNDQIYYL